MKRSLFLLAVIFTLLSCSNDDEIRDEFSQRNVTAEELESGTATYFQTSASTTYYLVFNDGKMKSYIYKGGTFTDNRTYDYSIDGDSIHLIKRPFMGDVLGGENEYYSLYINMVHWGYLNKGDQLLIRGDGVPYNFKTGYYDKSLMSLN